MGLIKDKVGNYIGVDDLIVNDVNKKAYKILFVGDSAVVLSEMDISQYPAKKLREITTIRDDLESSYIVFTPTITVSQNDLANAANRIISNYDVGDMSAREFGEKMWEIFMTSKPK